MESLIGQTLHDKYRIGEMIGRGGMGSVYRAEHIGTGRPVAVKTILPRLLTDASSIERFRREARAAGSLRHPNIVDVTDFGVARIGDQEVAYLVMEYLEGSTLRALLERAGTLRVEIVVEIVEQIALALDAAHRLGIVHRDLKPDNIWLVPDPRGGYVVRILDFGIAKLREPVPAPLPDAPSTLAPSGINRQSIDAVPLRFPDSAPVTRAACDESETATRASVEEAVLPGRTAAAPPGKGDVDAEPSRNRDSSDSAASIRQGKPIESTASANTWDASEIPTSCPSEIGSSAAAQLTGFGTTLGTPAYMSPEQCRGARVDARSDIYSLGLIAWQALVGRHPFGGKALDLIRKQLEEIPPRVDEVNAAIPRKVGEAISVAMAKAPDERYASAGAMAGALRVAGEGPAICIRRSMALYLERFDAFFRISLRSVTPVLAVLALEVVVVPLVWLLLDVSAGSQPAAIQKILRGAALQSIILVNLILWMLVTSMHHAVFASVVESLRSRPLDELDFGKVLADVRLRIGLDSSAGLTRTILRLMVYYIRAESRGRLGQGDLAFQIAFHEGGNPGAIFDRCLALSRATKRSYDWIRVFIFASLLLPPVAEFSLVFTIASLLRLQPFAVLVLATCVTALLIPVNAILINPGISPSFAVLYFRARQALGESVALSAVMPSRL